MGWISRGGVSREAVSFVATHRCKNRPGGKHGGKNF